MKNDSMKGRTLGVASALLILIVAFVTCVMYVVTNYYLYYFLAVTSLFLGVTNLLFMALEFDDILSKLPPKEKKKKKKKVRRFRRRYMEEEEEIEEEPSEEESTPEKKRKRRINIHLILRVFFFVIYLVVFYLCNRTVLTAVKTVKESPVPTAVNAVFLLTVFVVLVVLDRLCKYAECETPFEEAIVDNSRQFFVVMSAQALLGVVCVIFDAFQLFNLQKYMVYVYAASFYYYVAFITISLMVIAIRKEFCIAPFINVPLPRFGKKDSHKRPGFIEYLEKNTGISMRSLWSVKYVKQIAPLVFLASAFLIWISTSVVQVETYQQAAVYRIGNLQEKKLGPGIHLTLPYPFDKVEVYDTEVIQKMTIGYRAEESTDNIWTKAHEGEEFKLLLGGGDELVSINLRLEYKISNLDQYLKTTSSPESVMQALAYELVTDETIATDLSTFLSIDRDELAEHFKEELTKMLKDRSVGLEVVSVVLESIHPPVEIAAVYQELISAEITAEKYLLYAEGNANVKVAQAETNYYNTVGVANADYATKVANAKSSVTEFLASVEAYKGNKDSYTFYKYLAAVREAYGNANLVILGNGVDASQIYFGSIGGNSGNSSGNDSGTTTTQ